MPEWPLILNKGFGDVLPNGRWGFDGARLIAEAYNSGDWSDVEEYARLLGWEPDLAD